MRACNPQTRIPYGSYYCATYGTYGKDNPTGCKTHRVKHSILEALVEKYLGEVSPKVAELVAAVESDDCSLFDLTYVSWMKTKTEQNRLWSEMNKSATPPTDLQSIWDVGKRYNPQDRPELQAEIDAKEAKLDEMLGGFCRLSPALQDRANQKMETLQSEIDDLKAEIEDLTAPWRDIGQEVYQRAQTMHYAASLVEEDGCYREKAEALHGVVDRIVCHYRDQGKKSIIDCVEIYPCDGGPVYFKVDNTLQKACFTDGMTPARG